MRYCHAMQAHIEMGSTDCARTNGHPVATLRCVPNAAASFGVGCCLLGPGREGGGAGGCTWGDAGYGDARWEWGGRVWVWLGGGWAVGGGGVGRVGGAGRVGGCGWWVWVVVVVCLWCVCVCVCVCACVCVCVCLCVCVCVCVCVRVPYTGCFVVPQGPLGPRGPTLGVSFFPSPTLGVSLFPSGPLGPGARGPDPAIDSPNVMLFVWILALLL
jgi:hypothetical protein